MPMSLWKKEILVAVGDVRECGEIAATLEESGHLVMKAHSGAQAHAALRGGGVALAILDASLKGTSGIKILEVMRSSYDTCGTPWTPVIFISDENGETEKRARRSNADVFFFKPVTKEMLLEAVGQLLRGGA